MRDKAFKVSVEYMEPYKYGGGKCEMVTVVQANTMNEAEHMAEMKARNECKVANIVEVSVLSYESTREPNEVED